MRHLRGKDGLAEEIAGISHSPRKALAARWEKAHGCPPPKGISRRLLEYAVAYDLQSKVLGDLKPATKRKLSKIGNSPAKDGSKLSQSDRRKTVSSGSMLRGRVGKWPVQTVPVTGVRQFSAPL